MFLPSIERQTARRQRLIVPNIPHARVTSSGQRYRRRPRHSMRNKLAADAMFKDFLFSPIWPLITVGNGTSGEGPGHAGFSRRHDVGRNAWRVHDGPGADVGARKRIEPRALSKEMAEQSGIGTERRQGTCGSHAVKFDARVGGEMIAVEERPRWPGKARKR